jgi:uncharacterized protein (TIGR01777 family)
MQKILVTGGSGMIGTRLTELLLQRGHEVVHLGRHERPGTVRTYLWDVRSRKIDARAFEGTETIVHLAGESIGDKPWTKLRKQEILESRTHSARLLFDTLKAGNHKVRNFVSASAVGYYGFGAGDEMFDEDDEPGQDFLASVVRKWEEEVDQLSALGLRVVKVRVGIVLSKDGGALKEMVKPVKFYVGAPLGSGNQMLSWIHIDDVCGVFIKAIEDPSVHGAINAVGPNPVSNRDFTKAIARAIERPVILPAIPSLVIKLLLGEMATLVLKGNSVSNEKLLKTGFTYKFSRLDGALQDLLK